MIRIILLAMLLSNLALNALAANWCDDANTQFCVTFDDNNSNDLSQNTLTVTEEGDFSITSDGSNPASYSSYYGTFDGNNDYLTVDDSTGILDFENVAEDFSICFWIDPNTVNSFQAYFYYADGNDDFWRVMMFDDADFTVSLDANDQQATTNVSTGWEHHCAVIDRDGNITFYLNGSTDGTASAGSEALDLTTTTMHIGVTNTQGFDFSGDLDEIIIYSGLLDSDDISDIYNNGIDQAGEPPSSYTRGVMIF